MLRELFPPAALWHNRCTHVTDQSILDCQRQPSSPRHCRRNLWQHGACEHQRLCVRLGRLRQSMDSMPVMGGRLPPTAGASRVRAGGRLRQRQPRAVRCPSLLVWPRSRRWHALRCLRLARAADSRFPLADSGSVLPAAFDCRRVMAGRLCCLMAAIAAARSRHLSRRWSSRLCVVRFGPGQLLILLHGYT